VRQLIFNRRAQVATLKKRNLITFSNPDSIISDQFRTIRTNIQFLTEGMKNRKFLITSTGKGEGKSTISANLAVSMAQQQKKILLIDANLRDAIIHSIFKLPNDIGLTNVLTKQVSPVDAVKQTEFGNLDILTSGTTSFNPLELLSNEIVKEMLDTLVKSYDIILIDSSSVLDFTESRVLANQCDGVVFVVNRGKTEIEKINEAKRVLELAHGKLVGVIMNEK